VNGFKVTLTQLPRPKPGFNATLVDTRKHAPRNWLRRSHLSTRL